MCALGKRERQQRRLEDSGLPLKPANILDDLIDIRGSDGFDLWHVAELPMVSLDPIRRSQLKGRIAMVIRLIDFMHERRALLRADAFWAVTGGTVGVEFGFTGLQLSRQRPAAHGRFRLRGVAGDHRDERSRQHQHRHANPHDTAHQ
jgi:hypothetical protein